jgi:hypothetical protein
VGGRLAGRGERGEGRGGGEIEAEVWQDIYFCAVLRLLYADKLKVKKMWAVCNPMLVNSFALTRDKFAARAENENSSMLFNAQKWRFLSETQEDQGRREWTIRKLEERCQCFSWNKNETV